MTIYSEQDVIEQILIEPQEGNFKYGFNDVYRFIFNLNHDEELISEGIKFGIIQKSNFVEDFPYSLTRKGIEIVEPFLDI